ncbi:MAG: DUF1684 domain-containing protein [Bacteroidales bacterium]
MSTIRLVAATCLLATAVAPAPLQDADYARSIERWRADHESALRADDGWLTVVGLEWLKPGPNRAGSTPTADIKLPPPAPPNIGVFQLDRGQVKFEPAADARAQVNGNPASSMVLRPDVDKITSGTLTLFVIKRGDRFGIRIKDRESEARRKFTRESWYPARESWKVVARFEPYQPPKMIPIANVLGQVEPQPCPGVAVFVLGGKECRLEPIAEGSRLFFIFRDATSGKTTYGAGRFLYASRPEGGRVVLDFNKAENPPCAFTPFATCPLPPRQNELPIRVEAGERYSASRH